jgi:hypothetical protein
LVIPFKREALSVPAGIASRAPAVSDMLFISRFEPLHGMDDPALFIPIIHLM